MLCPPALTCLYSFNDSGPLKGVWPTIDYLQDLGPDYMDLILNYSEWVIEVCESGYSAVKDKCSWCISGSYKTESSLNVCCWIL